MLERDLRETGRVVETGRHELVALPGDVPRPIPISTPEVELRYLCRHLHRYELRTDYVKIVKDVGALVERLPVHDYKPVLVLDHTGVGRPVLDLFMAAGLGIPIVAITITPGQQATQDPERPWEWKVPKKDLVGVLQVVFQNGRFFVAPQLPLADTLGQELQTFRLKVTASANVTYEAWREGQHDDLVLACAMGVWVAERFGAPGGIM